jgi:CheY-like chemotaxis protein
MRTDVKASGTKGSVAERTVLIVEDERILREAYRKILSQEGFRVLVAADGEEALAALDDVSPNLILLDMLMPHMDGLSFLEHADLPKRHPEAKVIAFSNLSNQQGLNAMMHKGATMQLLKSSLSPRQLAAIVRKMTD